MDKVRARVSQNYKNRQAKLFIALIVLVILTIAVIVLEKQIKSEIKDVVIMKNEISDEKASFFPIKALNTNIIAVKTSDGKYNLAFDDCTGCYNQYGKHFGFKNNDSNTGLVCKNCKNEIMYDEMGFLPEQSMPLPIIAETNNGIRSLDDRFVFTADYLNQMKDRLERMRKGKPLNNYSENPNK